MPMPGHGLSLNKPIPGYTQIEIVRKRFGEQLIQLFIPERSPPLGR